MTENVLSHKSGCAVLKGLPDVEDMKIADKTIKSVVIFYSIRLKIYACYVSFLMQNYIEFNILHCEHLLQGYQP